MPAAITLVMPPLTQLNTPYPSIAYLARHLRGLGHEVGLRDLGLELALALFSREGLSRVFDALEERASQRVALPEPAWRALALRRRHEAAVGPVIRFLQGGDRALARRILETPFLPAGPRLAAAELSGFGPRALDDAARRLATLYLEDLADLVTATIDPGFSLIRYQHHLAAGPRDFDALAARLDETTLIDALLDGLADTLPPGVVGLSVPFPGNLYAALRVGRRLRARGDYVVMGGGYVNTELRAVDEPGLWACVDALTYDDGEGPLAAILAHRAGGPDGRHRTRTAAGLVGSMAARPGFTAAADYRGLDLGGYLQLVDSANPAQRLWSDGRWNKITLAHGCYWKRCAFCDVSLDYIARFEPARAGQLADQMAELVAQTGQSGFHFVDEAAPPRVMRDLALAILDRQLAVSWWGNIRFERAFTPDLARLLAASGLVAVTGGLECAGDRWLAAMDKGVTVAQVARAAAAFRDAGVMVHAYLMYGFPGQTLADTVDALEVVRQMFAEGLIRSGFWHRFVLTRHSPIAMDPPRFGVEIAAQADGFAQNDLEHIDLRGDDPAPLDDPLSRALAAYMRGEGLDRPARAWFGRRAPRTRVKPNRIRRALRAPPPEGRRLVWLGGEVLEEDGALALHHAAGVEVAAGDEDGLAWLGEVLDAAAPGGEPLTFAAARAAFPGDWSAFAGAWAAARRAGLIAV